jgi:hypothetical protein
MIRILSLIGRNGVGVMASGVFIGLAVPDLAALARPLLSSIVVAMLAVTLARVDMNMVRRQWKQPVSTLVIVAWLLLGTPLIIFFTATALYDFLGPNLHASIVLWSACPPLISAPALAILMGLNGGATLLVMIVAIFVFPFTLPPVALWLLDIDLAISPLELFARLLAMIAGSAVLGFLARHLLTRGGPGRGGRPLNTEMLDGLLVICLLLFAVAIMDGVTATFFEDPWRVGTFLMVAIAASLALQTLGALSAFWLDRWHAGAIAVASGNRNMALIVSAAGTAIGPDAFLFLAVLQIPIYTMPVLLKPVYQAWCRFGRTS